MRKLSREWEVALSWKRFQIHNFLFSASLNNNQLTFYIQVLN